MLVIFKYYTWKDDNYNPSKGILKLNFFAVVVFSRCVHILLGLSRVHPLPRLKPSSLSVVEEQTCGVIFRATYPSRRYRVPLGRVQTEAL